VSELGHRRVFGEQSLRLADVLWVGANGGGGENVDLSSLFYFLLFFFSQNPLTNEAKGKIGRKIINDQHMTR
jgi:hypothetical protein